MIPPWAQYELQSSRRDPAWRTVTGMPCLAAVNAAAQPATPDPSTSNLSCGPCRSRSPAFRVPTPPPAGHLTSPTYELQRIPAEKVGRVAMRWMLRRKAKVVVMVVDDMVVGYCLCGGGCRGGCGRCMEMWMDGVCYFSLLLYIL
mmetsp:Transcript_5987/g.11502  ORF Transcript_5987/g.11502 Transcript_5987/m.11502 type:complete len:145 (-) Transcript_5987:32-466(-)